jgi:hypothetical protein
MPLDLPPDLLLFVAGEPYSGVSELEGVSTSLWGRVVGFATFNTSTWWPNSSTRSTDPAASSSGGKGKQDWHIPRAQNQCAQLAVDMARERGLRVMVVDVNHAGSLAELVTHWVSADDLLPLLVRPDGSRLQGEEEFVPRRIRAFLRGPLHAAQSQPLGTPLR